MVFYRPVGQGEYDASFSNGFEADRMPSPNIANTADSTPLSIASGGVWLRQAQSIATTPSNYHAISDQETDSSYDILTADDEWNEILQPNALDETIRLQEVNGKPQGGASGLHTRSSRLMIPEIDSLFFRKPTRSPEPLRRSYSFIRNSQIVHPKADSRQGSCGDSVQQLEQSAFHLSLSPDLEGGIKKIVQEQKRSDSRKSSSRGQRSEEVDLGEAIRKLSLVSASRKSSRGSSSSLGERSLNSTLHEQAYTTHPSKFMSTHDLRQVIMSPGSRTGSNLASPTMHTSPAENLVGGVLSPAIDRPTTAASTETTQQARTLFNDFDGIHRTSSLTSQVAEIPDPRRISTAPNHLLRQSFIPPNSVYYPAPIPAQLNVPKRLSRQAPPSAGNQRKSQFMAELANPRQSQVFLPQLAEVEGGQRAGSLRSTSPSKSLDPRGSMVSQAPIHPVARASAFFDQPVAKPDIEMQSDSAVATLDNILKASAGAPVDAFTDHLIAGPMGSEVYGSDPTRRSVSNLEVPVKNKRLSSLSMLTGMLNKRRSKAFGQESDDEAEEEPEKEDGVLLQGSEQEEEILSEYEEEDEVEPDSEYVGKPTTLLAELQLRKQQQKMRTKLIPKINQNGRQSTLLELDDIAQRQKESRKHKLVTLAWEDPSLEVEREVDEDEDVPLGLILAKNRITKLTHGVRLTKDFALPLGIVERREIDDNEPLAQRKERLHISGFRTSTMLSMQTPILADEPEDETLAQRMRRLKAAAGTTTMLGDIQADNFIDLRPQLELPTETSAVALDEEQEETLAQRRLRLQAEAAKTTTDETTHVLPPILNQRRSISNFALPNAPQRLSSNFSSAPFIVQRSQTMYAQPALASNGLYNAYGIGVPNAAPQLPSPWIDPMLNSADIWSGDSKSHTMETGLRQASDQGLDRVEKWRSEIVP
jgi:hypothetical protein